MLKIASPRTRTNDTMKIELGKSKNACWMSQQDLVKGFVAQLGYLYQVQGEGLVEVGHEGNSQHALFVQNLTTEW